MWTTGLVRGPWRASWYKPSIATEKGGKEEHFSKDRQWGWHKSRESSQGCCSELRLGLRLQTRRTRREDDQIGFYEHLKKMNLEEKRDRGSKAIKDEDGSLLTDVELIRQR